MVASFPNEASLGLGGRDGTMQLNNMAGCHCIVMLAYSSALHSWTFVSGLAEVLYKGQQIL